MNQDTTLGCIRTEIEELMGAETTGYREALKDVKKFQDKAALYPGLDSRTWRLFWETVDRDLALFPLPDLRGLIIWSTLPRHLQQDCRRWGFINRAKTGGDIPRSKQHAFLKAVLVEAVGVPSLCLEAKFSLTNFPPMGGPGRLAQFFDGLRTTCEIYYDSSMSTWDLFQAVEFGDMLRRLTPP